MKGTETAASYLSSLSDTLSRLKECETLESVTVSLVASLFFSAVKITSQANNGLSYGKNWHQLVCDNLCGHSWYPQHAFAARRFYHLVCILHTKIPIKLKMILHGERYSKCTLYEWEREGPKEEPTSCKTWPKELTKSEGEPSKARWMSEWVCLVGGTEHTMLCWDSGCSQKPNLSWTKLISPVKV